jgi:hypothetical protein
MIGNSSEVTFPKGSSIQVMILSGFKEEIKQVQKIRSQNEVAR